MRGAGSRLRRSHPAAQGGSPHVPGGGPAAAAMVRQSRRRGLATRRGAPGSMNNFPHLAQRLFNTPLALLPSKGEMVIAALADRFGIAKLFNGSHEVVMGAWSDDDEFAGPRSSPRGYDVVAG